MAEMEVKRQVREFYNQVGWQLEPDGVYQNARYEDLRPVSAEYIHRCHMRVNRFLQEGGGLLLDVGSGPVQYPEYVTYSENYKYRVCLDISITALVEARKRLAESGLYVVSDAANLPFKDGCFDGLVSLHTLHHLPLDDQKAAYQEFRRVLAIGRNAVVVNGWTDSSLMKFFKPLIIFMERIGKWIYRKRKTKSTLEFLNNKNSKEKVKENLSTGTFVRKMNSEWLEKTLNPLIKFEIHTWRSVSVRFLRAMIHRQFGGKLILRIIYWFEERFPRFFGIHGQYPLIVLRKS